MRTAQDLESDETYFSVAVYYLSFATYFCVKRLKMAISEDIVMRKQPFIRSRLPKVIDFGTNRKRVYTFLLVINNNFSHISHRFGDMAAQRHLHLTPPLRGTPQNFGMKLGS